jgi:hypothetical protein
MEAVNFHGKSLANFLEFVFVAGKSKIYFFNRNHIKSLKFYLHGYPRIGEWAGDASGCMGYRRIFWNFWSQ